MLLDFQNAIKAKNNVELPSKLVSFKEYGIRNTKEAVSFYETIFKTKPNGFWPAEGSVSLDTANLFATNGLKWFCTDEEILFKTINNKDKKNIYKNYTLNIDDKNILHFLWLQKLNLYHQRKMRSKTQLMLALMPLVEY